MFVSEIAAHITNSGFEVSSDLMRTPGITDFSVSIGKWFYIVAGIQTKRNEGEEFDILKFTLIFDEFSEVDSEQINDFNKGFFVKVTRSPKLLDFSWEIPVTSNELTPTQFERVYNIWLNRLPEMAILAGFKRKQ
jgi:hypothetical protein